MVSIVIPSYNAGKYVAQAVQSVLHQDVAKEIIVVDDCSSDASIDFLIRHFVGKFVVLDDVVERRFHKENCEVKLYWQGEIDNTPIRIYRNVSNQGVAVSRNIGVRMAKGEYVALLDADDWWEVSKLSRQLAIMEQTGAVLCNTSRELVKNDGKSIGNTIHTPEKITFSMLKKTNYINCSSVLIKREVLLKYPMEKGEFHEDYLTWLRILKDDNEAVGIDEPLMKYRLTPGGKSRNKRKAAAMTYRTYRRAGFGIVTAAFMMVAYTYNGLKKYKYKIK